MKRSIKWARVELISSTCVTGILILLLIFVSPLIVKASRQKQPKQNNWFISGNTGVAIRSREISGNLDFAAGGFRHQPGPAFDLSFGRNFGGRWEPAIRWGAYTLFGQASLPHYSSGGYYTAYPGLLKQEPLEYITQSNALSFVLRFLFSNGGQNSNSRPYIRPFIEAGLGINNYVTEARFSKIPVGESASLIFRNRNGENANGAGQIITGLGLKIGDQEEWNAVIQLNAEWVDFTTLNSVSQLKIPAKSSSRAIVSRLTAGLTIPIKSSVRRDSYQPFRW